MPALVTIVPMELVNVVAVVSTGVWEVKVMLDADPVVEVVVLGVPISSAVVPAAVTSVLSTAFRATSLTVAVEPAGSVTVSNRAPVGGGGAGEGLGEGLGDGDGLGEGDGLGGGEQHSAATPVAPVSVPGHA
jgi:hypothetical protein